MRIPDLNELNCYPKYEIKRHPVVLSGLEEAVDVEILLHRIITIYFGCKLQ